MYRFVSATHVLLYMYDLQLGKLKEICLLLKLYRKLRKVEYSFPLIYQAASHPSYIYIFNTNKFYKFKNWLFFLLLVVLFGDLARMESQSDKTSLHAANLQLNSLKFPKFERRTIKHTTGSFLRWIFLHSEDSPSS